MMSTSNVWVWYALLSAMFAALTAVFAKIGVDKLDSDYATFLRTIVITFASCALVVTSGKLKNPFALSRWTLLAIVLSGLATALSWIFYFRALKSGNASVVAPIDKLSIVFVAILSVMFLRESLQIGQWLGIGLIVLGSIFVVLFKA